MEHKQPTLSNFEEVVPSSSGNKTYRVSYQGDTATCECEHAQRKHGGTMVGLTNWCQHAAKQRVKDLELRVRYLSDKVKGLVAPGEDRDLLRGVIHGVVTYRTEEANIVAAAYLVKAYTAGEACADDVQAMVGDVLEGDPRIIGSVVNGLCRRDYLKIVGMKKSERKEVNHGRKINIFALTDTGRVALEQAILANKAIIVPADFAPEESK